MEPSDTPASPAAATLSPEKPAVKPSVAPPVRKSPAPGEAPSLNSLLPEDAGADPDEPQDQGPRHAGGFFNQPWVQNILPLATSLMFHVVIIAVGILLWKAAPLIMNPNKDQVIIPESKSIEKNAMPGGIEHPGLSNDKTRDAAQDLTKETDNQGFSTSASNNAAAIAGGPGSEETSFQGAKTAGGSGSNAFGGSTGGGTAPFGLPGGGGGLLPKSNFFGTGGNATKVVYLCDASGSMLNVFSALRTQLKESVNALDVTAGQQFNIIFFSDANYTPLFKDGMHIANGDSKKAAMEFIDNAVSTGGTEPLPAIKFAIGQKPELLYVLTDGFDNVASFDDVINAFKAGNTDGKMHVNCIYLESEPDPKLEQVLQKISADGHGSYHPIKKSDL